MAFNLKDGEFFIGLVREPAGDGEHVVVNRGTRSAVVSKTLQEALERNWDWIIELRRDLRADRTDHDDGPSFITLGEWSSLVGVLPPMSRAAVEA